MPASKAAGASPQPSLADPLAKGPLSAAEALCAALAKADPDAFGAALRREAQTRLTALLAGIERYRKHPYRRDLPEAPVFWQQGTSRLLDYRSRQAGKPGKRRRGDPPALLVVPSLVNRYQVLDLSARTSFLRWLAAQGLAPFVIDWDAPGEEERGFTLTDYIAGRLEAALEAVIEETGQRPLLAGYCMGGDLALALALRRQADLEGLILLATPWDFHAEGKALALCLAAGLPSLEPQLTALGALPVDTIQAFFAGLDPLLVARKFTAFSRLDPASPEAEAFVALEDWLNDGVPLAAAVARECLAGWYGANAPARGAWRVAGTAVAPEALDLPSLVVVPDRDRIVPPAGARVLAERIPGADSLTPRAGHIGMMASAQAPTRVWEPILTWVMERAGSIR